MIVYKTNAVASYWPCCLHAQRDLSKKGSYLTQHLIKELNLLFLKSFHIHVMFFLLEKAYFIANMSGLTMVLSANSDFGKRP